MLFKTIFLSLLALFLESCAESSKKKSESVDQKLKESKKVTLKELQRELKIVNSVPYLESYIQKVIKDGSSGLGFKSGSMQGGFADEESAKMISHYVVELSGKVCTDHQMAKKAQMYFTSNCGGCHGDDGKGQHGAFPDLTREKLLGIQKREEFLKSEILKITN